ncbi:rhodopsin-like protein [Brachionus plicatilis]|uniref:Rhodopsin-like protein n=1 Tax=Brachionus plicatilis TaxID=10195 RepID=A0A3M7SS09_BRAPC|nr:rhodopsin-like protein [Brachionus plicatilis]
MSNPIVLIQEILAYYGIFLIIIGTLSNLVNFYICICLRSNQTFIFLSYLTILNILIIYHWNADYILRFLFGIDWLNFSILVCKLLNFIQYSSSQSAAWILVLISGEQFLSAKIKLWRIPFVTMLYFNLMLWIELNKSKARFKYLSTSGDNAAKNITKSIMMTCLLFVLMTLPNAVVSLMYTFLAKSDVGFLIIRIGDLLSFTIHGFNLFINLYTNLFIMNFLLLIAVLIFFLNQFEGVQILPADISMRIEPKPLFEQVQVVQANIQDNKKKITRRKIKI